MTPAQRDKSMIEKAVVRDSICRVAVILQLGLGRFAAFAETFQGHAWIDEDTTETSSSLSSK